MADSASQRSVTAQSPAANAEVRRMMRQLPELQPNTLRVLQLLLEEVERHGEIVLPEPPPPERD